MTLKFANLEKEKSDPEQRKHFKFMLFLITSPHLTLWHQLFMFINHTVWFISKEKQVCFVRSVSIILHQTLGLALHLPLCFLFSLEMPTCFFFGHQFHQYYFMFTKNFRDHYFNFHFMALRELFLLQTQVISW